MVDPSSPPSGAHANVHAHAHANASSSSSSSSGSSSGSVPASGSSHAAPSAASASAVSAPHLAPSGGHHSQSSSSGNIAISPHGDGSQATIPIASSGPGHIVPRAGGTFSRSETITLPTAPAANLGKPGHELPFVKPSSYLRRKTSTKKSGHTMAEKAEKPMSPLDREQMQGLVSFPIPRIVYRAVPCLFRPGCRCTRDRGPQHYRIRQRVSSAEIFGLWYLGPRADDSFCRGLSANSCGSERAMMFYPCRSALSSSTRDS